MIDKEEVIKIHEALNSRFWGASGIRDEQALASALARPMATFDALDLYPSPEEKAAALAESLIKNHPFIEGNMRTAYVLMRLLLLEGGMELQASHDERHDLILDIATSRYGYEQIVHWLRQHMKRL